MRIKPSYRTKKSHTRVDRVWTTSCRYGVSKRATLNHREKFPKSRELSAMFLKKPADVSIGVCVPVKTHQRNTVPA